MASLLFIVVQIVVIGFQEMASKASDQSVGIHGEARASSGSIHSREANEGSLNENKLVSHVVSA